MPLQVPLQPKPSVMKRRALEFYKRFQKTDGSKPCVNVFFGKFAQELFYVESSLKLSMLRDNEKNCGSLTPNESCLRNI